MNGIVNCIWDKISHLPNYIKSVGRSGRRKICLERTDFSPRVAYSNLPKFYSYGKNIFYGVVGLVESDPVEAFSSTYRKT